MKTLKVGVRSFGSVINVVLQDDSFYFEISQNDPVINEPTIEYKAILPLAHTSVLYREITTDSGYPQTNLCTSV